MKYNYNKNLISKLQMIHLEFLLANFSAFFFISALMFDMLDNFFLKVSEIIIGALGDGPS